jgi:hypothetical protein
MKGVEMFSIPVFYMEKSIQSYTGRTLREGDIFGPE